MLSVIYSSQKRHNLSIRKKRGLKLRSARSGELEKSHAERGKAGKRYIDEWMDGWIGWRVAKR